MFLRVLVDTLTTTNDAIADGGFVQKGCSGFTAKEPLTYDVQARNSVADRSIAGWFLKYSYEMARSRSGASPLFSIAHSSDPEH